MRLDLAGVESAGDVRFAAGGQFCPTLVVGLGGSGIATARRIKRIQQQNYGHLDIIRYLLVDTDQAAYAPEQGQAEVHPTENANIITRAPAELLKQVDAGQQPAISDFLSPGIPVTSLVHADGAGGIRPVGRFAFYANVREFYEGSVLPACQSLLQVQTQVNAVLAGAAQKLTVDTTRPRVYVINSLCGGTGSSSFLDVAALIRRAFHENNVEATVIGAFYLPSVFRHERLGTAFEQTVLANGYAGLMELEYFSDPDIRHHPWRLRYPHLGEVVVDYPLFDECYLIEGTNAVGQQLASKGEVFELTARGLSVDIGSPVGARERSAKRNTSNAVLQNPCPVTGKYRLMNSLAATGLRVPVQEMLRYGCLKAARQVIHDRLLAATPASETLDGEVKAFLATNRLEERGDQDQLLDQLLAESDGSQFAYSVGRTREELEQEADSSGQGGEAGQARYVASWLKSELDRLRTGAAAEARAVAHRNLPRLLDAAGTAAAAHASLRLQEGGIAAADAFLGELEAALRTVIAELTAENDEHAENARRLEEDIQARADYLESYGSVMDLLLRRTDDERAMESGLELLGALGRAEVIHEARSAALVLLGSREPIEGRASLLSRTQEWRSQLAAARRVLTDADGLIVSELDRRVAANVVSTYVLEQDLVPPSSFGEYTDGAGLDPEALAAAAWKELRPEGGDLLGAVQALGALPAERVVDRIAALGAGRLRAHLEQHASVLQVIERQKEKGETEAEYVRRQLNLMLLACQPFWTASKPPGEALYENFVAVTVPCRADDPRADAIRQALKETIAASGATAELVEADYPFALEITQRAYGARSYYLTSVRTMQPKYEGKLREARVRDQLHLDKRFLNLLPRLEPESAQEARLLFAWGLAYGFIARRGEFYYSGVRTTRRGGAERPLPKYLSDGPTIEDLLEADWQGGEARQKKADTADLLAQGRADAVRAFCRNADRIRELEKLRAQFQEQFGAQTLIAHLEAYLDRLDEVIARTSSDALRAQYSEERELLDQHLDRLRGVG
jgi:hypothetical protein